MKNNYLLVDLWMTGVSHFSRFSHELSVTKNGKMNSSLLERIGKKLSTRIFQSWLYITTFIKLLASWLLKFLTYNQFIQLFANFWLQVQKYLKHKWFWLFSLLFHCTMRRRRNRGNGIFRVRLRQIFGWSVPTSRLPRSVGDLQRVPIFLIIW